MHSCAQVTAASMATVAAAPAAKSRPLALVPAGSAQACAASQATAAACSDAVSIHAQRCLTAWNWPIGRPNWWRIFA